MEISTDLCRAKQEGLVISVWRHSIEPDSSIGFVAGIGAEYFALQVIDDRIQPNGVSILRIADVTACDVPHRHNDFVQTALKLKGFERQPPPDVDLSSTRAVLQTAGPISPILSIHSELVEPDLFVIGHVISVSEAEFSIRQITPDAKWEKELENYPLKDVTRIDFQGGYEEALRIVVESKGQQGN